MDQLMMVKLQVYTISLLMVVLFPAVKGNQQMETKCNLQIDSSGIEGCYVQGHNAHPAYSCRPCGKSGDEEVHIISMYKGTGSNVPVHILANHPVHIKLLLSSHQITHWKINKPDFVTISQVIIMSLYNTYSSVTLNNGGHLNVTSRQKHFKILDETGISDYARSNLGNVTSFSAVYTTCGWWLAVGNCKPSSPDGHGATTQLPDVIWTPPDLTTCSDTLPCWIKYDFHFPLRRLKNQCSGSRYVTWYKMENTTYYIGAVLCMLYRYSLFMSTSLQDTFLHIADSNHQGEDHCELVGTDKEYTPIVNVELESTFLKGVMAYSRDNWGEPFQKGEITTERTPRWYQCGITIPLSEKLYSESDTFLTSPRLEVTSPRLDVTSPRLDVNKTAARIGQYAIFIVAAVVIVTSLGIVGRVMYKKDPPKCMPTCSHQFLKKCSCCFVRNQNEEPEQIPETPSALLLSLPSAPPLTSTEPAPPTAVLSAPPSEPPSAPSLTLLTWTPPMVALPPPAYQDALNYPRPETPPPTYESV